MSDGDEEPTQTDASDPEEHDAETAESPVDEAAGTDESAGADGAEDADAGSGADAGAETTAEDPETDSEASEDETAEAEETTETEDGDEPEAAEADEEADDGDGGDDESAAAEDVRAAERERYEELLTDLDDAADAVEAAETEDDLDAVEATLDGIADAVADAEFTDPEEFQPDEDELDEDEEPEELLDFEAELENELQDLGDEVDAKRGPYAADVVDEVESARATVTDTRWTETGDAQVAEAIESFVEAVASTLDADLAGGDVDALDRTVEAVKDAGLDADADAETIAALLDATDTLQEDVDDAQAFADLSSREKLQYEGFYDVLGKHKDFPPEWSAVKEWAKRDNAEMVALCMEHFGDSEYMAEHCLDAFVRMGNPESIEALKQKAQRRNLKAIEALGKTGHPDAVEAVADYIDSDSNPALQKTAIEAVGELGATEHTGDVAQWLVADDESVRSTAARALGLLGDARAIAPLGDVLADDGEAESVRASAAWALYQIGTEEALSVAAAHDGAASFLVQSEAERASAALD